MAHNSQITTTMRPPEFIMCPTESNRFAIFSLRAERVITKEWSGTMACGGDEIFLSDLAKGFFSARADLEHGWLVMHPLHDIPGHICGKEKLIAPISSSHVLLLSNSDNVTKIVFDLYSRAKDTWFRMMQPVSGLSIIADTESTLIPDGRHMFFHAYGNYWNHILCCMDVCDPEAGIQIIGRLDEKQGQLAIISPFELVARASVGDEEREKWRRHSVAEVLKGNMGEIMEMDVAESMPGAAAVLQGKLWSITSYRLMKFSLKTHRCETVE